MTAPSSTPPSRAAAALAVAVAGVLWGVSAVVIRGAFREAVDPLALVQARLALGSALLFAVLAVIAPAHLRLAPGDYLAVAVWGVVGLFGVQASYFVAVSRAGVATAIFLQYMSPLLTALWATAIARQRLGAALSIALGLSTSGLAALLFGGGAQLSLSGPGVAAGAMSAFAGAFGAVYGKRVLAGVSSPTLLAYGMLVALLVTLPIRSPIQTARELLPEHLWQVAYVVLGSTLAPFLLYLYGLRRLRPTSTILIAMLEPFVGVMGAWIVLGESLTWIQVAGGVLLLAGVTAAQRPNGGTAGKPASAH